jgi:plasmid stabilization system protein ParE
MNQYRVSDAAKSDLDEIWFYIAQDDPDAAGQFIRTLVSRFPRLRVHAGDGTKARRIVA